MQNVSKFKYKKEGSCQEQSELDFSGLEIRVLYLICTAKQPFHTNRQRVSGNLAYFVSTKYLLLLYPIACLFFWQPPLHSRAFTFRIDGNSDLLRLHCLFMLLLLRITILSKPQRKL
ncbi:hypothetical protein ABPG74_021257 [Tetrahymena malaccensis]